MAKRIQWVDIARGIAILAVVIGHTLGPYSGQLFGSFIFAFHMPIFFLLSGYLYHQRPARQEFKRGVINLLVPYAMTSLLVLGLNWLALHLPGNHLLTTYFPSTKQGLLAVLYGAGSEVFNPWKWHVLPIGAIWFLLSMFIAVQLFNLIMLVTKHHQHPLGLQVALVALFTIDGGIMGTIAYLPWALNAACFAQVFLYAGYLIRKTDLIGRLTTPWYILLGFMWAVSAFQGYFVMTVPASSNLPISIAGGVAASLCVIRVSDWLTKYQGTRFISLLERYGRASLIVLCFHLIDLDVIGIQGWLFGRTVPLIGNWGATVLSIVYRIGFATFWMLLIPRIPVLRVGFLPRKYLLNRFT